LDEDPIVFAFRDRVSLAIAALCAAILAAATFFVVDTHLQ
jgi:hypothetical protein